jgi:hypothetical protein
MPDMSVRGKSGYGKSGSGSLEYKRAGKYYIIQLKA